MNLHDVRRGARGREEQRSVFVRRADPHVDLMTLEHDDNAPTRSVQDVGHDGKARDRCDRIGRMGAARDDKQPLGQLLEPPHFARDRHVEQFRACRRQRDGKRLDDIARPSERQRTAVHREHRCGNAQRVGADRGAAFGHREVEVVEGQDSVADECVFR